MFFLAFSGLEDEGVLAVVKERRKTGDCILVGPREPCRRKQLLRETFINLLHVCCDGELFDSHNDEADRPIRGIKILHRRVGMQEEPVFHEPIWMDHENRTYPD